MRGKGAEREEEGLEVLGGERLWKRREEIEEVFRNEGEEEMPVVVDPEEGFISF